MRFLLTAFSFQGYHGSMMHLCEIGKFLSKEHQVDIVTMMLDEDVRHSIENERMHLYSLQEYTVGEKYDYAICYHFPILAALASKGICVDKIVYGCLSGFEPLELPSFLALKPDTVVQVHSDRLAEEIAEKCEFPREQIYIMRNLAPDEYYTAIPAGTARSTTVQKIAVVSNHCPEECLEACKILSDKGIQVDIYGTAHVFRPVTPELLAQYDVIVSIGKTVQYGLAMGIPVYNYDRFGGDGYITTENVLAEEVENFSGRTNYRRLSPQEIVDEIITGYGACLEQTPALQEIARERYLLSSHITQLLAAAKPFYLTKRDQVYITQINYILNRDVMQMEAIRQAENYNRQLSDYNHVLENNNCQLQAVIQAQQNEIDSLRQMVAELDVPVLQHLKKSVRRKISAILGHNASE